MPANATARARRLIRKQQFSPSTPAAISGAQWQQGMNNTAAFGPGQPLNPWAGYSQRPRATDYPVGVNINVRNRQAWGRYSFDFLTALVDAYDIARICINHKIDELRSMEPLFTPADGYAGQDLDDAVDVARAVLEFPDRELPYDAWLSKLLENAFRYDATPLYKRRNNDGQIIGYEVVDGTTVYPLIDGRGRRPRPPAEAYQQVIKGQVWSQYTTDDIDYLMYRPQSNNPFGMAPIESILLTTNTDIRFQWHFLQMFTDGSIPGGFIEAPPDTNSPDQVAEWQDYWDSVVMGDQAKLHQLIVVPNDTKVTNTKPDSFDSAFPEYLMTRTCAAFGVVPQDLGLIRDVNRANGETQTDIQFRVNTLPWVRWVEGILTRYLKAVGLPVKVQLDTGRDKEDRLQEAQAWQIYIDAGMASADEGRQELLGLPIDDERPMPRFINNPRTGPVPLASLLAIAGQIDPETGAPIDDVPLSLTPFAGAHGVLPDKSPGGTQFTRAPINPDEPEFPQLEKPVPGSDVVGTAPGKPVIGDANPSGIPGALPAAKSAEAAMLEQQHRYATDRAAAELHAFTRFCKARERSGKWRDFTFEHADDATARRLNLEGRVAVRKAAGEVIAAGLCVRAADTGRVLMLQRGWDPTDPASGMWEFPGGHLEDGEEPLDAAWREWQEETGLLIPTGTTVGNTWAASNGIYVGWIASVPREAAVDIRERGQVNNPDDPDGDVIEALAWWAPELLTGNPAVRTELAEDLPLVLQALEPSEVVKASDADPKAPSWRDGAPKVPQHHFDLQLTDYYQPLIAQALEKLLPVAALRTAIEAAASTTVAKATSKAQDAYRAAAREALDAALADPDALERLLRQLVADAWLAGGQGAGEQLGGAAVTLDGVSEVDWDRWRPGQVDAAALASDGGLGDLLDQAGVTIQGISGSLLDELGNRIGDGLAVGDSVDDIASTLGDIVTDPSRAEMIAHTETTRAISAATTASYAANDVAEWDWLLSDNACPECEEQEAANPHQTGDDAPPLHPRCRCAQAPRAESVGAQPDAEVGQPVDDSADESSGLEVE